MARLRRFDSRRDFAEADEYTPVELGGVKFLSLICGGKGKKCIEEKKMQERAEADARRLAEVEERRVADARAEEHLMAVRARRAELKEEKKRMEAEAEAAPLPAYRRLIASASVGTTAMENIETWPASRQYLLASIQAKLEPILEHYGRVLPSIRTVFNATPVGEKSVYGVVYRACIAKDEERHCWDLPETTGEGLYLIVKMLKKASWEETRLSDPFSGYLTDTKCWIGNINPYREILMGRLLNRLVVKNITPHFPMIYESFEVRDTNMIGFAMETCDIDFISFAHKVVERVRDDVNRIKLFRVAVLQLTHALLVGQKHFDFRHNDFHAGNAMMTLIQNSAYVYKFDADENDAEETLYEIPNAGMCWKLIDFGYSSSNVFCAEDNQTQFTTSHTLSHMVPIKKSDNVHFPGKDHALEMFDLLRFIHFMIGYLNSVKFLGKDVRGSQHFFNNLRDIAHEISVRSPKRGTLMDVSTIHTWWADPEKRLPEKEFRERYISSSGLLQKFFKAVARPFKIETPEDKRRVLAGHVFNADAHPFSPEEVLSGLEAGHFYVSAAGELVPLSHRSAVPGRARAT